VNALQKIQGYIEQYDSRCRTLEKEIPQLQEIASKVWKREDELKSLKTDLAALDRKIQLELAPQVEKESKEENKEETNNVKADVISKGLLIKDSYHKTRIF
jgi:predicted nuclease with TOPRIM domain